MNQYDIALAATFAADAMLFPCERFGVPLLYLRTGVLGSIGQYAILVVLAGQLRRQLQKGAHAGPHAPLPYTAPSYNAQRCPAV